MLPLLTAFKTFTMLSNVKKGIELITDHEKKTGLKLPTAVSNKILEDSAKKSIFASKKFWISVLGFLIPVLNNRLGWELNVSELSAMIAPLIAYTIGQGIADKK